MNDIQDRQVAEVFQQYPSLIQKNLLCLRQLILTTAAEMQDAPDVEETLKWGEPSYLTKQGSTIRLGWKAKQPQQYALYFNCKSKLVDTFKELYADQFQYQGNRALVFDVNEAIPTDELKHCLSLALNYHTLKHLPLLGS